MNCRPGDLAIIIASVDLAHPEDIGKLVNVVEPGRDWSFIGDSRFHWACTLAGGPIQDQQGWTGAWGPSRPGELIDIPDAHLRPIRDSDSLDEVTSHEREIAHV